MEKFFQNNLMKLRNSIGLEMRVESTRRSNDNELLEINLNQNGNSTSVPLFDIKIKNTYFNDITEALDHIEPNVSEELADVESVLLLKNHIVENFNEISTVELNVLSRTFKNKSIVILFMSKSYEKFSILWKSREIDNFMVIMHYCEYFSADDADVYEFVANFLTRSLSFGHLGIHSEYPVNSESRRISIHGLADHRDYNLLLLSSESGNTKFVQIFLHLSMDTESSDETINAQSIALKNGHFNIILVLTNANMPYPIGIDIEKSSKEFKEFYEITEELHGAIVARNKAKVMEILSENKNLSYFYNLNNDSAAKIALMTKAFEIYEILLTSEIYCTPLEYEEGIFDNLDYEDQKIIRELHNKLSKDLPDKHINVIMTNSYVGHDVPDAHGKLKHVYEAYKFLSQDPRTDVILKAVAAFKKFKIIYDFNRDAVNVADPTVTDNTEGVFYPMGRIYIGARQLLDKSTRNQAIATLAHELCHFAINLAFDNDAKPYKSENIQTMQEFDEINEISKKNKNKEIIVGLVYKCYSEDMQHAELIVRVPHLITLYRSQPDKLAELNAVFPELFNFYENKTVTDLQNSIPEIEKRDERAIAKKDEKILNLRRKLIFTSLLSITVLIMASIIVVAIVHKTEYKFSELFDINDLVYFDWMNMTENSKEKFLNSNLSFQNENLEFRHLYEIFPDAFNYLTFKQISSVLNGDILAVGKFIENKTTFYVERKFIYESQEIALKATLLDNLKNNIDDITDRILRKRMFVLSGKSGSGKTVTFEQLTLRIKQKYPLRWVSYIDLKNHTELFNFNWDVKSFLENILGLSSENKFEMKIFEELFGYGYVILLWDGFDEISSKFHSFILKVQTFIQHRTRNLQCISTKPFYSLRLQNEFKILPYQLLPFDNDEITEFLTKFLISKNVQENKVNEYLEDISLTIQRFELNTPLMLIAAAEAYDHAFDAEINFYETFERIEANNFLKLKNSNLTMQRARKLYQKFAIIQEFPDYLKQKKMKVMRVTTKISFQEITNMRILSVNGELYEFVDDSLAYFFAAQFFIENIYLAENGDDFDELILEIFDSLKFKESIYKFIGYFLDSRHRIKSKTFNSKISKLFRTKYPNIFFKFLDAPDSTIFDILFKFFQRDHELLVNLMKVNENETLYTAAFNAIYDTSRLDPSELKEYAEKYLTEYENDKFLSGNNQKGVILFGLAYSNLNDVELEHDEYEIDSDHINEAYVINFIENFREDLTEGEIREVFAVLASNPDLFFALESFKSSDYAELWNKNHNLWQKSNFSGNIPLSDIQSIIASAIIKTSQYEYESDSSNQLETINILINKLKDHFSNSDIFKFYKEYKILHHAAFSKKAFEKLWNFFTNHSNEQMQKEMLLTDVSLGTIKYLNADHEKQYFYDCSEFKIFHISLFNSITTGSSFNLVAKIYQKYFNTTEIRNIILSSNDFIVYHLAIADSETCGKFAAYLEKLFVGNDELLYEFLTRNISSTNSNIRNYFHGLNFNFGVKIYEFYELVKRILK